jgi:hypothetical protein
MRYLLLFLTLLTFSAFSQQIKVSGVVKSSAGEIVPYAAIIDSVSNKAVYADNSGYFSLLVKSSGCVLSFSQVSFSPATLHLFAKRDTFVTVILAGIEIPEVMINGTSLAKQAMLGVNFLEGKTIQNIPSFFGESDLIKSMTVLPGIAGGLDIYSSIYVRGGNRDQNLFLVDGARYYTTSHFGGYLSLFNPDIISHVDIYKGIAPAKFGDGISSVIDVRLNQGSDKPGLNVDIGTLRSGFLLESKGNGKLYGMLAGRISQIDLISGSAFKNLDSLNDEEFQHENYVFKFWDFDGKLCYKPSAQTLISINGHIGNDENASFLQGKKLVDKFGESQVIENNGYYIDNHNLTLNVRHLFPSGISLKNTAWFTYYNFTHRKEDTYYISKIPEASVLYENSTYIKDFTEKIELNTSIGSNHYFNVGAQFSSFAVNPSFVSEKDEIYSTDSVYGFNDQKAFEGAFYIDDDINLFKNTVLKLGIRTSILNVSDSSFLNFEPRFLLSREIAPDWSFKVGYSRNSQPVHTLVQTFGFFEKESWILSDKSILPQLSNQVSGGVFGKIPKTTIEVSFEVYYKKMENLLFLNPIAYETKSMFDYLYKNGAGKCYGSELLIQKTNGKIQWSIAYTLSWSKRKFEVINDGEWFYSEFDRRHDLNIGLHYFSGKKNIWNMNYIYQTGRPFTMPVAFVQQTNFYNGFYVLNKANNARMPSYKRFDISYKRKGTLLWGRKSELTLSVMNLFAHKNPSGMFVRDGKLYMSSLYVIIPSVNFKLYLLK